MGNSYTVVPAVIPGNVTIGGNLLLPGGFIKIGAAAPFLYLGKDAVQGGVLSWNFPPTLGARDDATRVARALRFRGDAIAEDRPFQSLASVNAALTDRRSVFADYARHNHTGTLTEDTILTTNIPGNVIPAGGALRIRTYIDASASQGATLTNFRWKMGAITILTFGITGAGRLYFDFYFANRGATNSQFTSGIVVGNITAPVPLVVGTSALDTTAAFAFTLTAQNGTGTDNQNFELCEIELANTG